jgi:hypothetical protein
MTNPMPREKPSAGLRITGIMEPIRCIEADDGSRGWMAGVGIAGLIPAWKPGGYITTYTLELISPKGEVVNDGILSQSPGETATSTTAAIGGLGLSAGGYTVRVRGNGEEDTLVMQVPDCLTTPPESEQHDRKENLLRKEENKSSSNIPEHSRIVDDVYLEDSGEEISLTVKYNDETKYSAILNDRYICNLDIDGATINTIRTILDIWRNNKVTFAQEYIKSDRTDIEFLYDVVALAKYASKLPKYCKTLLKVRESSTLMHNRIMAQLLHQYHSIGLQVNPKPTNFLNNKRHDFNVSLFRCEVKTIQPIGMLEYKSLRGLRFTAAFERTLAADIRDDLEYAREQVREDGIIILAPWSYRINALLTSHFKGQLSIFPPPPKPNLTILVLTSRKAFEDYYISFHTCQAQYQLQIAFSYIQAFGIMGTTQTFIREGFPFRASTAPVAGSVVSLKYETPREEQPE